jgi:hypothetical protein
MSEREGSRQERAAGEAGTVSVAVLGTRFDLGFGTEAVGAELRRVLRPFLLPPEGSTSGGPGARLAGRPAGADPVRAVGQLLAELNAAALEAADCLAVHAGAVSSGGRVVAFPGPSGIGKSTLTACCLRAGMEYVSDEALCLSWDTGAVIGYPRAVALSRWSAAELGLPAPSTVEEVLATAADLGATVAAGPLVLAHVVLVERTGGRTTSVLHRAARGDAVAELLRRSFTHWRRPDRAFALAHEVMRQAQAWRLALGDLPSAAALVGTLLDGAGSGQPGWPRTASR